MGIDGIVLRLNCIIDSYCYLYLLLLGKDGKLTYFMKNVELVGNWVMLVMALENGKMA